MLITGLTVGALCGLGLTLLARGLFAGPAPLGEALRGLTLDDSGTRTAAPNLSLRAADALGAGLARLGLSASVRDADLRVAERSREQHQIEKLVGAVAGLALPPALTVVTHLGGVATPVALAAAASVVLAIAGYLLPDALLKTHAAERRRAFRYALSSYLDLVTVILAAGTGVETALLDAASTGRGWAFRQLRSALERSRLTGESPWRVFGRLGEDLDLPELREVASSLDLAGTHGARVRMSLEARARAMRSRDLAETEAEAESATERMSIPSVVLVVGFIVFVGFPAAYEILGF
jgi:Flp pilus assembly protein TadB